MSRDWKEEEHNWERLVYLVETGQIRWFEELQAWRQRVRAPARYSKLDTPDVWGDFGRILMAGMEERNEHGTLELLRTGPFVPPVSVLHFGVVVVTDAFRRELESSGLRGLTFAPVIKKKVVEFHWEPWDRNQPIPDGLRIEEPEDIILKAPASEAAAQALGVLWEARPGIVGEVEFVPYTDPPVGFLVDSRLVSAPEELKDVDCFMPRNNQAFVVSAKARAWLESRVPDWVAFERLL